MARHRLKSTRGGCGRRLALRFPSPAHGRRFSGSLNATRQEAIDTSDRYTEGNLLPLRPRDEISATAGLAIGRGRASWDFTYVGPNYTDTVNSESGRCCSPRAASTYSAASIPESAPQKSRK